MLKRFTLFSASSALSVVMLLVHGSMVRAESSQELLSRVYQAGDIDALESLASEKIQANPSDAVAHFFMGVAYYKQKRLNLARAEFKEVLKYSKSAEEMRRARQYIDAIAQESAAEKQVQPSVQSKAGAITAAAGSASEGKGNSASAAPGGTSLGLTERNVQEHVKRLQEEAKESKQKATEKFDLEVKELRAKEKLEGEAASSEKRIKEAFERLNRQEAEIDRELARRISELHQSASLKAGQGDTRILPGKSNLYTRTYEHLGDDSQAVNLPSENAMSAKAQKIEKGKRK
ncbi:MAG: hypothetical protein K2Y32_08825 [Candidatus Obscuribacterales bacterium]|nr:hypothetical protein [Candidatus Obscuribacterales bacterium]